MVCPQDPQNLLSGGFCAEHFGHCTIDGEVIGIWRTPPIICDYLQEGKHVCQELDGLVMIRALSRVVGNCAKMSIAGSKAGFRR